MAKRTEIVPAKRRALILDHLRANGAASILELSVAIDASDSTIRRDLDHLVDQGYLERTHGGALLVQQMGTTFEREPHLNAQLRRQEKEKIGMAAAQRLRDGDSVIFESSSTVFETARAASGRNLSLTVITNSLDIAQFATGVQNWNVIVPGGTVRQGSQFLAGELVMSFFRELHVDVLIAGAWAVSATAATDASLEVASIKRAMVASARKTILVADSSKFSELGFCNFCKISQVHELITDSGIDPETVERISAANTKVSTVRVN
ncbi:DeoR/GlpR family DNA-binding transcription regulator [Ruegeria hyattellae]|uniref:DeoR/GlpR family DNA-binding transcription regulator n=1 Tax=Ruegeria hyattellae TaxID=3233337 RepID=UPI00355BF952